MATTKRAAAKAPAKKAAPAQQVKKASLPESERDWTYLAEKDPTDLHVDMAAWLEEVAGIKADLKTVQAVCVLRMVYQRSDRNKARGSYRALPAEVIKARSVHMGQAAAEAKAQIEAAKPKANPAPARKATTTKATARKATATKAAAAPARKRTPAKTSA